MIEPEHPKLPVTEQCQLLGLPRSSYYHEPLPESDGNQGLMRVIDETYLACPFFGSRQMTLWLRRQGYRVNRKRVRRLMRLMGLEALSPKPRLSAADHAVGKFWLGPTTSSTDFPMKYARNFVSAFRRVGTPTTCVLGPPYSYRPSPLSTSTWTTRLDIDRVAGLSVYLFGRESLYNGRPGVVPAPCAT